MEKRVEWLNLPKELWLVISKHLTATIDILRFRSTCKSWRSLLPFPSSPPHSLFPPQVHFPLGKFSLLQTKLYRLEPSSHQPQDPSISSFSSNKGWIIKVGESKSLPLRLLDPFTDAPISHTRHRFPPNTSPKVLNLINFRVIELLEAYTLNPGTRLFYDEDEDEVEAEVEEAEHVFMVVHNVRKVVLFEGRNRMVFVLQKDRKLGVSKFGENEDWSFMDDGNMHYDDIILHKGQLYVVDKWGIILWIDSSSVKLVQFSPRLCGFGKKKQLVEYGGSLYVVDMYIEGDTDNPTGMNCEVVVDIKVYKLDEEWGRWLDVKDLGDVLFVLGKDSNFSLSAQDYYGCEGNCVYFYSGDRVWCFSLEDSKFKSTTLFWPCPNLFHPKFNT